MVRSLGDAREIRRLNRIIEAERAAKRLMGRIEIRGRSSGTGGSDENN
jgi:hypothetical protein